MSAGSGGCDVLIHVQHLLGIGHLQRAATIARALDAAGLRVTLATGGMPLADLDAGGAEVVQLPPLRSRDEGFTELVDDNGRPVDEAWKAARRERLLALYRARRPKVLLIELFPFGRRQLRFELLPLIEAARADAPRPWIVSSLRDILNAPSSTEKSAWILGTARELFDLVLVHGDPAIVALEASFTPAAEIADKLRYTGYVTAGAPASSDTGTAPTGEVLVSTGGGAVAGPLIEAALEARPLTAVADVPWRLLIGHNLAEAEFRRFAAAAPEGVRIERARPDFRQLLARARLSISQAGYNTVLEVLAAGVPAVVVPFAAGGETEQTERARRFERHGLLTWVETGALSGASLAAAIGRALARPAPDSTALRGDGAARTAELVSRLVTEPPD